MDILTPHNGINNEKIAKAQIEAVEKKQNKYKLIGQLIKVSGHTLFQFNTTTREVSRANCVKSNTAHYDPNSEQLVRYENDKVAVEKDCYYEQALNVKNFIKRLRRRGIIGETEIVNIV